jgi:tetratricopeptide (TPR) repeat protein
MKLYRLWLICVLALFFSTDLSLAQKLRKNGTRQIETFPLLDEVESPETKTAKEFLGFICTSNMFINQGTIGQGRGELNKSISYLSKNYLSKITPEKFIASFGNAGAFKLLQLYSSSNPGDSADPNQKQVFFEISLLVGDEPMKNDLFLGGTPPETTGASSRVYYGFITFVEEDGTLKVDQITYNREFPMGGGHQPWRDGVDYMGQLAMGEGFSNENMDTTNCDTREVHPGRLVYVTCTDQIGSQKKTAKMVYPSGSVGGWICIQVLGETETADNSDPLVAGVKFARKKEFGKAILEYQKAIDADANNFRACELMGYAYYRIGHINEAIQTLSKLTDSKPDYALGHYNLALAYWANGQKKEAIEEVRKVIGLNPKYREEFKRDLQFKDFESSDEYKGLINP